VHVEANSTKQLPGFPAYRYDCKVTVKASVVVSVSSRTRLIWRDGGGVSHSPRKCLDTTIRYLGSLAVNKYSANDASVPIKLQTTIPDKHLALTAALAFL
jgi:hypothetical protein